MSASRTKLRCKNYYFPLLTQHHHPFSCFVAFFNFPKRREMYKQRMAERASQRSLDDGEGKKTTTQTKNEKWKWSEKSSPESFQHFHPWCCYRCLRLRRETKAGKLFFHEPANVVLCCLGEERRREWIFVIRRRSGMVNKTLLMTSGFSVSTPWRLVEQFIFLGDWTLLLAFSITLMTTTRQHTMRWKWMMMRKKAKFIRSKDSEWKFWESFWRILFFVTLLQFKRNLMHQSTF